MKIDKPEIRLAMLGMIEGNGHPYSWSAIVNGYNPEEMAKCPFPVIPQYLAEVPRNYHAHSWARASRGSGPTTRRMRPRSRRPARSRRWWPGRRTSSAKWMR